jgi:hypothetical protein
MSRAAVHKGAILHCFNRGVLGRDIFDNETDRWRFLEIMRYKNHETAIPRWHSKIKQEVEAHHMPWPDDWDSHKPLVSIAGYTLMDNHFHLILEETQEGGIASFMRKLANSYIGYKQAKDDECERLFRGTYQSTRVLFDNDLRLLFVYVLIKNNLERLNGGIEPALDDFDTALQEVRKYPFTSLAGHLEDKEDPIVNNNLFTNLFQTPQGFIDFAKEQMDHYSMFKQEVDESFIS